MNNTVRDLKKVIRSKYAWPGGYEFFGLTDDGEILCTDCMRKEFHQIVWSIKNRVNDGWQVVGIGTSSELESTEFINENMDNYATSNCVHCNKLLNP